MAQVPWVTAAQLAEHLAQDVDAEDPALARKAAASDAWCKRHRPDVDPEAEPPADIAEAALLYAELLWLARNVPGGLATFTATDGLSDAPDAMNNVYRLLGRRGRYAR